MTQKNQHVKTEDLFLFFFFGVHLTSTGKTVRTSAKTFFLEITSYFGQNCGIFFACFGVHKTGIPSYLSWPRAHVRLSAPLVIYTRLVHETYFFVPSHFIAVYACPIPSHPMGFPSKYNSIKVNKFMKILE